LELVFLVFIAPECAKYRTYEKWVWQEFWLSCGAVLVLYTIWPALRWGSIWLRLGGSVLCVLPVWVLAYVVMEHFDLLPLWLEMKTSAHALHGGIPSCLHVQGHWPAASDVHRPDRIIPRSQHFAHWIEQLALGIGKDQVPTFAGPTPGAGLS
jgi:hypothetical protein